MFTTAEETEKQLRTLLSKVEELQPQLSKLSRDQLLELWMHQDEKGHYGDPVHQFALVEALRQFHNTTAPLYPYDVMTDEQRFSLQPSSIIAETERRVRALVEQEAAYAFGVMEKRKFSLDEATRSALVEGRIRLEMASGHKYWKKGSGF